MLTKRETFSSGSIKALETCPLERHRFLHIVIKKKFMLFPTSCKLLDVSDSIFHEGDNIIAVDEAYFKVIGKNL